MVPAAVNFKGGSFVLKNRIMKEEVIKAIGHCASQALLEKHGIDTSKVSKINDKFLSALGEFDLEMEDGSIYVVKLQIKKI